VQGLTEEMKVKFPVLTTYLRGMYQESPFGELLAVLPSEAGSISASSFLEAVQPKWTTARTRAAFIEVHSPFDPAPSVRCVGVRFPWLRALQRTPARCAVF
jgi:hypothetical protein